MFPFVCAAFFVACLLVIFSILFRFPFLNVLCFADAAQTGVGQNLRTLAAHLFKMFVFSFSLRMAVKRAGPGFLNQNAAC